MATTTKKSPSKAKTKTAKTASATKKTTVKKATASKVAAKATATKKTSPFEKAEVTLGSLRRLHLFSIGLFAVLAVAAGFMMNSATQQLTLGYLAKDELASTSGTVLASATQSIYDVEVRWLVVGVLALSMIMPLLYLTKLKGRYNEYLTRSRMLPLRWIDFAVTGALMTELVALLSGASDIATLKLIGGLVATTAILGLIAERQNNVVNRPVHSAYYTSLLTGLLPWAAIGTYAVSTVVYGTASMPWHVYALYAALLGGFLLQARNQHMEFGHGNYLIVERNYTVISALTKMAFAAILIVGLAR
jgi:hypothetical protein